MASCLVTSDPATHGCKGRGSIRSHVAYQTQAFHCAVHIFASCRDHCRARFHGHDRFMGRFRRGQGFRTGFRCEYQVRTGQGRSALALQARAYRKGITGNGSHRFTEVGYQGHPAVGCQFLYIMEVDLRRIYIRTRKGDVGRTGQQRAAVLPLHIGKCQLAGFVFRGDESDFIVAGLQVTKDLSVNSYAAYRTVSVRSLFRFFCHFRQCLIGLQQGHGCIHFHLFRIANPKPAVVNRSACIIVLRTASVQRFATPFNGSDVNSLHIFLANFIGNRVIRYIRLCSFDHILLCAC